MTDAFCPACRRDSPGFEPVGTRPEARCPRCQGVERNRLTSIVFDLLGPWLTSGDRRVLEVGPQPITRRVVTERFGATYVGVDLFEDRSVDAWADVTRLPFASDSFDLVLCSHVLEHVADDRAAMRELARVCTPHGLVVVFVPHRPGRPTDEGPLRPGETRTSRFGQDDHVRWYGHDLDDRLLEEGLRPVVLAPPDLLTPDEVARFRLDPEERMWLCAPAAAGPGAGDTVLARLLAGRADDLRASGLLERRAGDGLRELAAIRARADASFGWEREAGELRLERDSALRRAERAEESYRRLAAHPVVRVLRAVRRLVARSRAS